LRLSIDCAANVCIGRSPTEAFGEGMAESERAALQEFSANSDAFWRVEDDAELPSETAFMQLT
jgi:hypothetical protein